MRETRPSGYPSFSFTTVNIAVAMLTTINVAIARQTASDSVNFQIARIQRTVQATSETVMTTNAIHRTIPGSTTPRVLLLTSTTTSGSSHRCSMNLNYIKLKTAQSETTDTTIHKITPCSNGLTPTAFNVLRDKLAPIRKSVSVIPAFARFVIASKMLGSTLDGAYVLTTVASKKNRINQGIAI